MARIVRQGCCWLATCSLLVLLAGLTLEACGESSGGPSTTTITTGSPTAAAGTAGTTSGSSGTSTGSSSAHAGSSASTSTSAAARQRLTAVTSCLQGQGITLPRSRSGSFRLPRSVSAAQYRTALEHCVASTGVAGSPNRLPPAGRADSSPAAANRGHYPLASPALVKYAECLRRGGVDILVRGTSVPEFNPQKLSTPTPALAAAERRCANALP